MKLTIEIVEGGWIIESADRLSCQRFAVTEEAKLVRLLRDVAPFLVDAVEDAHRASLDLMRAMGLIQPVLNRFHGSKSEDLPAVRQAIHAETGAEVSISMAMFDAETLTATYHGARIFSYPATVAA